MELKCILLQLETGTSNLTVVNLILSNCYKMCLHKGWIEQEYMNMLPINIQFNIRAICHSYLILTNISVAFNQTIIAWVQITHTFSTNGTQWLKRLIYRKQLRAFLQNI